MVLVKLRLAVPYLDLAYRLRISSSMVSRILSTWLTVMDVCLGPLVKWPERDDLYRTMPRCFLDSFGRKLLSLLTVLKFLLIDPLTF